MPRPRKYKSEAERAEARKAKYKKYNSKRSNKSGNHYNPIQVKVVNHLNCNDSDSKLAELQKKYDALVYELEVTNEYCAELEDKLAEAKEMGY